MYVYQWSSSHGHLSHVRLGFQVVFRVQPASLVCGRARVWTVSCERVLVLCPPVTARTVSHSIAHALSSRRRSAYLQRMHVLVLITSTSLSVCVPLRSGHRALDEVEPASTRRAPHRRALRASHRSLTQTPTPTQTRTLRLRTHDTHLSDVSPIGVAPHAASHLRSRSSLLVLLSSFPARDGGEGIRSLTWFVFFSPSDSSPRPSRAMPLCSRSDPILFDPSLCTVLECSFSF